MAGKIDVIRGMFSHEEGFHFREDIRHNLTDVTLPRDYSLISKEVKHGLLKKIEFKDPSGRYFCFQN